MAYFKLKPLLFALSLISSSVAYAETSLENKSQAEINKEGQAFAKSLDMGAPSEDSANGVLGVFATLLTTYNSIATATYNTNVIPSALGNSNIQECLNYTQAEINTMINSADAKTKMRGIECDATRTKEKTNDQMENRRIDPKKDSMIKDFNENQNKVVQTDSEGNITISCATTSTSDKPLQESCVVVATPSVRSCYQVRNVSCYEVDTHKILSNVNTDCEYDIGIDRSKPIVNATIDNQLSILYVEQQRVLGQSTSASFYIRDISRSIQMGHIWYGYVDGYGDSAKIYVNGRLIHQGADRSTQYEENFRYQLVEGHNTVRIENGGWWGIAIPYGLKTKGCNYYCSDSWNTQCTDKLMTDDGITGDDSTYSEDDDKIIY